jgi:hypothetical protein
MKILLSLSVVFALGLAVFGHSNNAKIEQEVIAFRAEVRAAVKAKDRKALERFLADGFTHTHASGKVDPKKERIEFFLKGEPTIEDVEPDEIRITGFGKNVAIANGKTTVFFGAEKRVFQWTGAFLKSKGKWQLISTTAVLLRG